MSKFFNSVEVVSNTKRDTKLAQIPVCFNRKFNLAWHGMLFLFTISKTNDVSCHLLYINNISKSAVGHRHIKDALNSGKGLPLTLEFL